MEQLTLIQAIRKHLTLDGENLKNIAEGYKALTDKDKADLTGWFGEMGIEIKVPA